MLCVPRPIINISCVTRRNHQKKAKTFSYTVTILLGSWILRVKQGKIAKSFACGAGGGLDTESLPRAGTPGQQGGEGG